MTPTQFVNEFWQHTVNVAEQSEEDFKYQALPLARIKKVMKIDPEVKMISSEVMVLFEKACQIFIQEMTARAHLVSLDAKRRTLTRNDVEEATSKSDVFDFLIDLLPPRQATTSTNGGVGVGSPSTHDFDEHSVDSDNSSRRTASRGKGKSASSVEHSSSTKRKRQTAQSSAAKDDDRDGELDEQDGDVLEQEHQNSDEEYGPPSSRANGRKRKR
ncbi:CCAAT- binding transcription factor component [Microbotryomycetes sp. JL201]|nr:CCAAT- binding transcription factor component [Microbotryomycetes sp. JL201]